MIQVVQREGPRPGLEAFFQPWVVADEHENILSFHYGEESARRSAAAWAGVLARRRGG